MQEVLAGGECDGSVLCWGAGQAGDPTGPDGHYGQSDVPPPLRPE
jgi:hypothetical protein